MDTLSSGNTSDVSSNWRLIKIDDAEYLISFKIAREAWKICLSNLIELWCETLDEDSAARRCEKLNPLLNASVFNVKKILQDILDDIPRHAVYTSLSSIRLEASISGGAFKFNLNLTKASPQEFWEEITKPLCQSSMEMQRRQSILLNLIGRKDQEISEYKARGGELIRKTIETSAFHEDLFKETPACTDSPGLIIDTFKAMMDLHNRIKKPESTVKIKSESLSSGSRNETTEAKVSDVKIEINQTSGKDLEKSLVESSEILENEEAADGDRVQEIPVATKSPAKRPRRKDKANDLPFS